MTRLPSSKLPENAEASDDRKMAVKARRNNQAMAVTCREFKASAIMLRVVQQQNKAQDR